MQAFTVKGFVEGCKRAMAEATSPQAGATALLQRTLADCDRGEVLAALEAAIPPGADIGEMIVHSSDELTVLFARLPPRFQSGIHDHSVFACIGQLEGAEKNTFYERDAASGGLRVARERTVETGEVIELPADAIHSIENPSSAAVRSLHLYGGDFHGIEHRRHLWTSGEHEEQPFSFPALMRESVRAMKLAGNETGLEAIVEAVPAMRPVVESLDS